MKMDINVLKTALQVHTDCNMYTKHGFLARVLIARLTSLLPGIT